ncbi:TetR/AcrR family transcriptional regulator [Telmatobacter bradus]|uniref:TetR/AcrR family transcriptional regulator n=1 Tax=Telmatobacter bradus TaxID=474953 RepID=UPI003B43A2E0
MKNGAEAQILSAASKLFSRYGYNGVSTRDIASEASVNEVTIYRHFPRKRDLYIAVLDTELQQIKLRGDLLGRLADAPDARVALQRVFELISSSLLQRPDLLRLLQFSSLELGEEMDAMLRLYLGEPVELITRYLDPWLQRGELHCSSAKSLVLAQVSIVLSHGVLHRLFLRDDTGPDALFQSLCEACEIKTDEAYNAG